MSKYRAEYKPFLKTFRESCRLICCSSWCFPTDSKGRTLWPYFLNSEPESAHHGKKAEHPLTTTEKQQMIMISTPNPNIFSQSSFSPSIQHLPAFWKSVFLGSSASVSLFNLFCFSSCACLTIPKSRVFALRCLLLFVFFKFLTMSWFRLPYLSQDLVFGALGPYD